MRHAVAAVFSLSLLLAACVQAPEPEDVTMDRCKASELQGLVGQPASVLETMRFSQVLRVIPPGAAITMDFLPTRLNVNLDEAGVIRRLWCG